jgi:hypothetical protein
MKAITVHQPWSWAIIHAGKNIENRTQLWRYRGPLAIHAGKTISKRALPDPAACQALDAIGGRENYWDPALLAPSPFYTPPAGLAINAVIGTVQLVDAHWAVNCCAPWGESSYRQADGKTRRDLVHLVFEDPVPVKPYSCRGAQGLWELPDSVNLVPA